MERPRLLLVPNLTELEWLNRPLLEEWADVASYDAPGVGDEPPAEHFGSEAIGSRGREEIERRGWDRCFVVADEFGVAAAVHIVAEAPEAVQAMALGHARMSNSTEGERAADQPRDPRRLRVADRQRPALVRAPAVQDDRRRAMEGGYGDDMVDEYRRARAGRADAAVLGDRVRTRAATSASGCAGSTCRFCWRSTRAACCSPRRASSDAAAALPSRAHGVASTDKPSTSPEFARSARGSVARSARRLAGLERRRSLQSAAVAKTWKEVFLTANGAAPAQPPRPSPERRGSSVACARTSRRAARRSRGAAGDVHRPARRRDLGAARGDADLRRRRRPHDREGGRAARARGRGGALQSGEELTDRLRETLAELARTGDDHIDVSHEPSVILTVGVNGTGKTTTIGKVAWHLQKEAGLSVVMAAARHLPRGCAGAARRVGASAPAATS